jgi:hypothetical protein
MERVDLRGEVSQRRFLDLRLDEGFACFGQLGCEISFGVSLRRHLLSPLLRRQSPPMPTDGAHNPACPAEKAVGQAERDGVLARCPSNTCTAPGTALWRSLRNKVAMIRSGRISSRLPTPRESGRIRKEGLVRYLVGRAGNPGKGLPVQFHSVAISNNQTDRRP